MSRSYAVIDADGHVLEPLDLWDNYIEPTFRDRAPKLVTDDRGKQRLVIDDTIIGSQAGGVGALGGVGARQGVVVTDTLEYSKGRKGGFDPHARIPDMDLDGIDAAVLFPSLGLFVSDVRDSKLAAAICRAYNRWIVDYCKPYPDRLFGMAMLPMQSIELALDEMRFARTLGLRGGFLRPNPYNAKMWHLPDYERFWALAQELDFCIGFHEGAGSSMPTVGVDRFPESRGARHIVSHPMEMMLACLSVIWGGVVERYPQLRIAFLESGGGWVAPWIDRMDRHFDDRFFNDSNLKNRPSDLFRRNCWISFEPVEGCLSMLADYVGPERVMWATDYPHPDGFFPGAPDMVRKLLEKTSPRTQYEVLAGGAMKFYGLS
ncbi:MAG: amidohydrolase family protein [Vicinamibacterales bacterium]